jgi:D-galactarolactone cycloisomerase
MLLAALATSPAVMVIATSTIRLGRDLLGSEAAAVRQGVPLRVALGGHAELASVPAYASGLNPDTAVEAVGRARDAGFTAFKVKVAFGLEQDLATVDRIKAALHPSESLMVDANQGWDIAEARDAVARLSDRGVGWIEEPIPADRPAKEWAELAVLSDSPLAGGENLSGFSSFADLIRDGSHRIVQLDLLKWGGVTGCHAVARQAVSRGLVYCPDWLGSAVGLIASAQILAAVGGQGQLEHDVMDNPLREAFTDTFPRVAQGRFPLPGDPGIGFTLNVEQAKRWLVKSRSFES